MMNDDGGGGGSLLTTFRGSKSVFLKKKVEAYTAFQGFVKFRLILGKILKSLLRCILVQGDILV